MNTKEHLEKFSKKIVDNFDATDSYKLKTSGLQDKFPIVNSSGEAHGGTTAKISFIHPRGLSEYDGDIDYGGYGVFGMGFMHLFTADEVIKSIKCKIFKLGEDININVGVYKYAGGGLWPSGNSISGLEEIETFTNIEDDIPLTSGDFYELKLTNIVRFLAGECLVFVFNYSSDSSQYLLMRRYSSDPYSDRIQLVYNTEADPINDGTWTTGWYVTPLILSSDKVSTDDIDSINASLALKANIDLSDGTIHGGYIPSTVYLHPRGLAEVQGDNFYGGYGVFGLALRYLSSRLDVIKKIKFRFFKSGSNITVNLGVYKKTGMWTSGIKSELTLIELFTDVDVSTASDALQVITLSETLLLAENDCLVVLCAQTGGTDYFSIGRWDADTYSDRIRSFYNLDADPLNSGSWVSGHLACPLILEIVSDFNVDIEERVTLLEENSTQNFQPRLAIPSKIYAVVGHELNLWYDALLVQFGEDVKINVSSTVGLCKERCWRFTPDTAGTYSASISVSDRNGLELDSASFDVIVAEANAGSGTKQVLFIGDSLTNNGDLIAEFRSLVSGDGGASVTNLGTKGTAPNLHEGIPGATWSTFATDSGYSPFWIGGKLDFQQYMTDNGFTGNIDYAQFMLGVNDSLGGELSQSNVTAIVNYAKSLVDALLSSGDGYPGCKIMIALPTISGNTKDGFATNYGSSKNKEIYERNIRLIWENFVTEFDNPLYSANVYLMIPGLMVDRTYGYTFSSENISERETGYQVNEHINAVHPSSSGYHQIADAYYNIFRNLV